MGGAASNHIPSALDRTLVPARVSADGSQRPGHAGACREFLEKGGIKKTSSPILSGLLCPERVREYFSSLLLLFPPCGHHPTTPANDNDEDDSEVNSQDNPASNLHSHSPAEEKKEGMHVFSSRAGFSSLAAFSRRTTGCHAIAATSASSMALKLRPVLAPELKRGFMPIQSSRWYSSHGKSPFFLLCLEILYSQTIVEC